jgi:hypothetical protein
MKTSWLRMPILAALYAALLVAPLSCGSGDDSPIGVNNVSPHGSVGGLIVDATTQKTMQGVTVSIIAGGKIYPDKPVETDGSGYFAINDVPSGELLLRVVPKAGYQAVTIEATLPNSAGEFPLANATLSLGPIGLVPTVAADSGFKVLLIKPDGTPPNPPISAFLRTQIAWIDFNTGTPAARGITVSEAKSDNNGLVRFGDMPDFSRLVGLIGAGGVTDAVRVSVPPVDANKDGVAEFLGKEQSFSATKLAGSIPTIVLSTAAGPLNVVASNIAGFMGKAGNRVLPGASGPLYLVFNWPIVDKLTDLGLYDEQGKPVASAPTKSISGNVMTINFQGLNTAAEYNLNIRTFGDVEGTLIEGQVASPIFTPVGAKVQATLKRDAKNTNRILVTFSEPIGTGVAGQALSGVLFFDFDINGGGTKGDAPGERNSISSTYNLAIEEVDPPGQVSRSGLSTVFSFDLPMDSANNPIPAGTYVDFLFSRTAGTVAERPDGTLVPDLPNQTIPN